MEQVKMTNAYQKANIPGPEVGVSVADPLSIANIIKRSSHILLIIGAQSVFKMVGDRTYSDVLFEIGSKIKAEIIATAGAYRYFSEKGQAEGLSNMPLINITDRLRDSSWINLKGEGEKYDLIIVGGFLVYYVSQTLSTLKNFTEYRTVSLDRYHHPNARFSLPNLEKEEWNKYLEVILSKL